MCFPPVLRVQHLPCPLCCNRLNKVTWQQWMMLSLCNILHDLTTAHSFTTALVRPYETLWVSSASPCYWSGVCFSFRCVEHDQAGPGRPWVWPGNRKPDHTCWQGSRTLLHSRSPRKVQGKRHQYSDTLTPALRVESPFVCILPGTNLQQRNKGLGLSNGNVI